VLRSVIDDAYSFARLVIGATIQVVLLTYVIMPRVTTWLRSWLFR
jgi:antibiotic biosynthesis monooxygenase (ABM) superfamily enzyme